MDAIYARQSIDKKDSISIEGQIDLCRKECTGEPVVFTDKGYSGKNTDRPAFKKLMSSVERGEIQKIVVYRLDRISRSITDFGRIWDMLKSQNVDFVSVNEKFDTSTPVGRAMIYIIMVFAQLERETIAERIKDNYYQRAKRGAYLGGPAPYGFDIKRTLINGKAASMLVPNDKIDFVRMIFGRYSNSDISLGKLGATLLAENIPGISRKGWDNVALARILHNPVYVKSNTDIYYFYKQKGVIIYNDIDDFTGKKAGWLFGKRDRGSNKYTNLNEQLFAIAHHDGVIDSDTWLRCQYRLEGNTQIKNSGKGSYTWLTGLVKCGYCGYAMKVISTGNYMYFICSGRLNLKVCNKKLDNPHVSSIEPYIAKEIERRLLELRNTKFDNDNNTNQSSEIDSLKIELSTIDSQISNLIDNIASSNSIASRYINERITKLDQRKSEILGEIKSQLVKVQDLSLPDSNFNDLTFDEKKALAHILIKRIELTNDEIKIEWANF